ncbi:hypothetical protein H257_18936 [Aphanomyces astaci]|uniref:Uncharacterized protein n=1 Tax=Aphanomyces astaci TaxID=112090 RepID=W4F9H0_APHAT|nr:hypothetical protein H257_18936 [Aphanomyces astaci]ETV64130.1 hypothetical protein H257_18936 [Aphanomyces astaci]|eukprot:XP_009846385.1 hypothetical protein H257_18936 [Aphanomyces astaci]
MRGLQETHQVCVFTDWPPVKAIKYNDTLPPEFRYTTDRDEVLQARLAEVHREHSKALAIAASAAEDAHRNTAARLNAAEVEQDARRAEAEGVHMTDQIRRLIGDYASTSSSDLAPGELFTWLETVLLRMSGEMEELRRQIGVLTDENGGLITSLASERDELLATRNDLTELRQNHETLETQLRASRADFRSAQALVTAEVPKFWNWVVSNFMTSGHEGLTALVEAWRKDDPTPFVVGCCMPFVITPNQRALGDHAPFCLPDTCFGASFYALNQLTIGECLQAPTAPAPPSLVSQVASAQQSSSTTSQVGQPAGLTAMDQFWADWAEFLWARWFFVKHESSEAEIERACFGLSALFGALYRLMIAERSDDLKSMARLGDHVAIKFINDESGAWWPCVPKKLVSTQWSAPAMSSLRLIHRRSVREKSVDAFHSAGGYTKADVERFLGEMSAKGVLGAVVQVPQVMSTFPPTPVPSETDDFQPVSGVRVLMIDDPVVKDMSPLCTALLNQSSLCQQTQ